MKNYFSSFSAVLMALFCAFPALSGAQDILERKATTEDTKDFTRSEKDLAITQPDYFTLDKDSIRLVLLSAGEEKNTDYVRMRDEDDPKDLPAILVSIEKIVNIGTKLWDIVKDNKPVLNLDTKYATAYPEGVTAASQMSQWSKPKSYLYGFYAENLYGGVMIDSKHKVAFSYGGAYRGQGKYLTAVAVIPTVASVAWGYRFQIVAAVPDSTVANVGTDANPVAAMQLKLTWRMSSPLKVVEGTSVYYIQGDGYFEEIASPWRKDWKKAEDVQSAAPLLGDPAAVF